MTKISFTGKIIQKNNSTLSPNQDAFTSYYQNGKCHKDDGPAVIYKNGTKKFFLHGIEYPLYQYLNLIPKENVIKVLMEVGNYV